MDIDTVSKGQLLQYFRQNADVSLKNILKSTTDYKEQAKKINGQIQGLRDGLIGLVLSKKWTKAQCLDKILLINYVSYVVMLEYRNKVWNYDYMAFSRRVGEIWEPFCKLPFLYPVKELNLYEPPAFEDIKNELHENIMKFIDSLHIDKEDKKQLAKYFNTVFGLVESGGIKLGLDLHFKQEDTFYNVDYKSGFSSNEKGNTNRLLLVASIYHSLPENHKTLIFVRQKEEENNHYLQTLKNSEYWEVFCSNEAYDKIREFTGFDLKAWMNNHMNWENDISSEFREYLRRQDLLKYLTW